MRHDDAFNEGFTAELEKRAFWPALLALATRFGLPALKWGGSALVAGIPMAGVYGGIEVASAKGKATAEKAKAQGQVAEAASTIARANNAAGHVVPSAAIAALLAPVLFPAKDEEGKPKKTLDVENLKRMLYGAILGGVAGYGINYMRTPSSTDIDDTSKWMVDRAKAVDIGALTGEQPDFGPPELR